MKNLILFTVLITSLNLKSQGLAAHIPSTANHIFTFNFSSIEKKFSAEEMKKAEFLKDPEFSGSGFGQFLTQIIQDPASSGIKLSPQVHYCYIDQDTIRGWMILAGLNDREKFSMKAKEFFGEGSSAEIIRSTGFDYISDGNTAFGWTNDFAVMFKPDRYSYSYYNELSEEENARIDSIVSWESERLADSLRAVDSAAMAESVNKTEMQADSIGITEDTVPDTAVIAEYDLSENEEEYNYEYDYEGESIWQLRQKYQDELWQKKNAERLVGFFSTLVNLPPSGSLLNKKSFREVISRPDDFSFYSGSENPFQGRERRRYREWKNPEDTADYLSSLFSNNYTAAFANFENGEIKASLTQYTNPEMTELTKNIYRGKIPKSFRKYVKGDNLLGFSSMSFDMEKTIKSSESMLKTIWKEILGNESNIAIGAYDLARVFLDDDVLYNLISGKIMVAVTDIRPFITSYVTYDYDEDFNRKEIRREKTETMPEFVMITETGRRDEMQRIIKSIETMGGLHREAENLFLMNLPGKYDMKIYVAFVKKNVIITNNETLVKSSLNTGYNRKQRMKQKDWKMARKQPLAIYWNAKGTFETVSRVPELNVQPDIFKLLGENLENLEITGIKYGPHTQSTEASLKLTNTSINSLPVLIQLMDKIFLTSKIIKD